MSEGQRRLAAIMFTDMVGYTALGQRNESLSLALVEEQRKLIRPILSRHNGREVKTIGDAFLVEFPNALDAVRCAYDIQRATREFNVSLPEDRRIHLRVGVHLGDVVELVGDISGDAVNVASRIEPLAEDGGVCLTKQVYDQLQGKFDLPLESLGIRPLKNVSAPIEVFRMLMPWVGEREIQSGQTGRKRIAVLPFVNISPDPNDEYFADGLTEELIDKLCQIRELEVIARTSVMNYKKKEKNVSEIGKELKAGALVEGSVRKVGDRIRVTAQLINSNTEGHLWSSSYDRKLDDVFAVQSDIAQKVAEAMKISLLDSERQEIDKRPTKDMAAYESYLRGLQFLWGDIRQVKLGVSYLEDAVRRDPGFSSAYAMLAEHYILVSGETGGLPFAQAFEKAAPLVTKALELDDNSSDAHTANANLVLQAQRDFATADAEFKRAIRLNPSNAHAHFGYAHMLRVTGDIEGAIEEMTRAHELDPLSSLIESWLIYLPTSFRKRDYEGAVRNWELLLERKPNDAFVRAGMAWLFLLSGRHELAEREAKLSLQLGPRLDAKILLAQVFAREGHKDEAQKLLVEMEAAKQNEYLNLTDLARVYFALGRTDEGFALLEEDFKENPTSFLFNYDDSGFDAVRADPRFISLVDRVHLPQKS